MNEAQYKIVKTFLAMHNTPRAIAKGFGISASEVVAVQKSGNYENYKRAQGLDFLKEMFGDAMPGMYETMH